MRFPFPLYRKLACLCAERVVRLTVRLSLPREGLSALWHHPEKDLEARALKAGGGRSAGGPRTDSASLRSSHPARPGCPPCLGRGPSLRAARGKHRAAEGQRRMETSRDGAVPRTPRSVSSRYQSGPLRPTCATCDPGERPT